MYGWMYNLATHSYLYELNVEYPKFQMSKQYIQMVK